MDKVRWPFPDIPGKLWYAGSGLTIAAVGTVSKIMLKLNRLQVHGRERFLDALENRDPSRGLITTTNHYSCADDPFIWGMLPWRHLTPGRCRWGMGAAEICFSTDLHATFFGMGKIVPVVRGGGVYQRCMEFMIERLNLGEWVHIFPEGRVNQEHQWLRLKWGIGRLLCETEHTPLLLPFYHQGVDAVQPNFPPYTPRIGKKVTIYVGSLLDYSDQVSQFRAEGVSLRDQRKQLTDSIQSELKAARYESESLHAYRL